jgi:ATP-dependent DNA helicase RecG
VELNRVLQALASGTPAGEVESELVDVKEEPGRRRARGEVLPGNQTNEAAAAYLAGELACLANSGGGAIVLGVADDGRVIGTDLDLEWLRYRIYELTDRKLTVSAAALRLRAQRVLELVVPSALEPIRYRGKIRHRVGGNCVEIDAATWADTHHHRVGYDWSAQPSARTLADVRAGALEVARDFLLASGEAAAADLAGATDQDLVRRLSLCNEEGRLLNAGAVLLCAGPAVIDYRRREVAGGDAVTRVAVADRSLLEQFARVVAAVRVHNPRLELDASWVRGETNRIPDLAAREAVVNGITHRDWQLPEATEIEHVGDRYTVTSPGGFVGGVSPRNIITHPSAPRYPRLAQTLATLRIAERQGIGVDRMHRDMLALGLPAPVIEELPGPRVRTTLIGGPPDRAWLALRSELRPTSARGDLDFLLVLDTAARSGWLSGAAAAAAIQRSSGETSDVLRRLSEVSVGDGGPTVLVGVDGDPQTGRDPYVVAWRLHPQVHARLAQSARHQPPPRDRLLMDYAQERGRISTTEAASLLDLTSNTARTALGDLQREGVLTSGREPRRGRGFFYVPVTSGRDS